LKKIHRNAGALFALIAALAWRMLRSMPISLISRWRRLPENLLTDVRPDGAI